jgi:hypothetical protein
MGIWLKGGGMGLLGFGLADIRHDEKLEMAFWLEVV